MAATGAAEALMKKGDKAATPGLFKFKSDWVGAGAAYEQAALKYRLAKAHAQAAHAYEKAADAQEKQGESRRAGAGRTSAHKVGGSCRADLRHACVFPPARPPARGVAKARRTTPPSIWRARRRVQRTLGAMAPPRGFRTSLHRPPRCTARRGVRRRRRRPSGGTPVRRMRSATPTAPSECFEGHSSSLRRRRRSTMRRTLTARLSTWCYAASGGPTRASFCSSGERAAAAPRLSPPSAGATCPPSWCSSTQATTTRPRGASTTAAQYPPFPGATPARPATDC